jgi:hypothetical protein
MSGKHNSQAQTNPTPTYQIRLQGHLGPQWSDWFEGLTITLLEDGETLLSGPVVDQPALHGLLKKVRDLGLPLLSVTRVAAPSRRASDSPTDECSEGE